MEHIVFIIFIGTSFTFGGMIVLLCCLKMINNCQKSLADEYSAEKRKHIYEMQEKIKEFEEITLKANKANESLASAVTDFDARLNDIGARVSMTRMMK